VLCDSLKELFGPLDTCGAGEADTDRVVGFADRALFDEAEHSGEIGAELAEPFVVRHDDHLGRCVQHTHGVEQSRDDDAPAGMLGADQIARDVAGVRRA